MSNDERRDKSERFHMMVPGSHQGVKSTPAKCKKLENWPRLGKYRTRWDGNSNENMDERCGVGSQAKGVSCGVVEWVKRNTLRWFGHTERMGNEEFVKKVYRSESVGPNSRGRLPGRWRDRVKEYMCERGASRGS